MIGGGDTYVDSHHGVSAPEVMQDSSLRQIGQVSHIFCLLKLRRITLVNVILLHGLALKTADRWCVTNRCHTGVSQRCITNGMG